MSFRESVFGLLGLLLVSEMTAAPVGVEKASLVANRFFGSSLRASKEVRLVYPSGQMRSSASSPCYVFERGEGMASSWSQGTIGVHGAAGVDIQVVDLRGVVRYMGKINENRFHIVVPSGVYMVRIGEHVERVVVP